MLSPLLTTSQIANKGPSQSDNPFILFNFECVMTVVALAYQIVTIQTLP